MPIILQVCRVEANATRHSFSAPEAPGGSSGVLNHPVIPIFRDHPNLGSGLPLPHAPNEAVQNRKADMTKG